MADILKKNISLNIRLSNSSRGEKAQARICLLFRGVKEEKKKQGLNGESEGEVEIEEGGVRKKQRVEYVGGGGVGSGWKPVKCEFKG